MKKILYIIIFTFAILIQNIIGNEIVLQKNNIIITNQDLENYKKIHKDFYGNIIEKNSAIKKLYLTFKIIDLQMNINPKFREITKKMIKTDLDKHKNKYSEYILKYFLRYEILKNDFVNNYINNNNLKELDEIINGEINFYNDIDCKIKKISMKFKNLNKNQKLTIISNLNLEVITMTNDIYICLNQKNINEINYVFNNIISDKGYEKFLEYVYKKIK
tara:strand:+ start:1711 stop:2364 length:654 start_codon:yes stop_codon:yes gene_type:complete